MRKQCKLEPKTFRILKENKQTNKSKINCLQKLF